MVAGHWAMATFAIISLGSWCGSVHLPLISPDTPGQASVSETNGGRAEEGHQSYRERTTAGVEASRSLKLSSAHYFDHFSMRTQHPLNSTPPKRLYPNSPQEQGHPKAF